MCSLNGIPRIWKIAVYQNAEREREKKTGKFEEGNAVRNKERSEILASTKINSIWEYRVDMDHKHYRGQKWKADLELKLLENLEKINSHSKMCNKGVFFGPEEK